MPILIKHLAAMYRAEKPTLYWWYEKHDVKFFYSYNFFPRGPSKTKYTLGCTEVVSKVSL